MKAHHYYLDPNKPLGKTVLRAMAEEYFLFPNTSYRFRGTFEEIQGNLIRIYKDHADQEDILLMMLDKLYRPPTCYKYIPNISKSIQDDSKTPKELQLEQDDIFQLTFYTEDDMRRRAC
jgi:hypothetical protein